MLPSLNPTPQVSSLPQNGAATTSVRPHGSEGDCSAASLRVAEPPSKDVQRVKVATLGSDFIVGYLSVPEAASYLNMGTTFVEGLIGGELRSYKFGRSRKIRVSDLERWASDQQEDA